MHNTTEGTKEVSSSVALKLSDVSSQKDAMKCQLLLMFKFETLYLSQVTLLFTLLMHEIQGIV